VVEAALDLALVREVVALRVEERFPGPGEDVRVVAADLQDLGGGQPGGGIAAVEEGVEGLRAPGLEGVQDVMGVADFGVEGVIEEVLEVPAELVHQVGVRRGFDGVGVGGGDGYRGCGFTVFAD
jgi:hypothetical protein